MNYVILDDPLKVIKPLGYMKFIVPLNIAESLLRNAIGQRIELTDLDGTFDLGQRGVFEHGKLTGWKAIEVF